jgi:hypothetical protein
VSESKKCLSHFLQSASALRKLSLSSNIVNGSKLLPILYSLDTLHELEFGYHINLEQVSSCLNQYPCLIPFNGVQTLSLRGDAMAVVTLLSSRTITNLTIDVQHPDRSFYTVIGSMVQLNSLDITLPPNEVVDQEQLESFRPLLNLQRLNMSKSETDDILEEMLQLPWMTDELFEKFFASFPLLDQLYLDWDLGSQTTEVAINALARCCPLLRRAMLMWQHCLGSWHKLNKPLFPMLEFLGLGRIREFTGSG